MSVEQFETEILELAGVRKVRTPEGSKKYGLPIGAVITADAVAAAEAAGNTYHVPEDDYQPKTAAAQHMEGTLAGKAQAEKNAPKPPAKPKLKIKIKKSELTGNKHFSVGKAKYVAPNGSKLIRPTTTPGMAYVVTPDGEVHAFNEAGEIEIPKTLKTVFQNKFNAEFEGDENYAVEEFEVTSSPTSLDSQKIGAVLTDQRGTPQFKKVGDDAWEHVDLGVALKDADLQEMYDGGELIPDTANDPDAAVAEETFAEVEATNFAEMTSDEFVAALDAMPVGQELSFEGATNGALSKNEDGTWSWTNSGDSVPATSLYFGKKSLKIGKPAEPEYNPLDVETVDPLDAEAKKLIGVGDTPDEEWLDKADPGAQLGFTNARGAKTTWTKQEDGSWENQKGGKMSPQGMKDSLSVGGDKLKIVKEGKPPKEGAQSTPAPASEPETAPSLADIQSITHPADFMKALDAAEVGHQIHHPAPPGGKGTTLTKQESGKWKSSLTDKEMSAGDITAILGPAEDGQSSPLNVVDGPLPEADDQAASALEFAKTAKEIQAILDAMPEGAQVHGYGSPNFWSKQEDGQWQLSDNTVMVLPSQDLASVYEEKGMLPGPAGRASVSDAPEPTQRSSSSLVPGEGDYTEEITPFEVEIASTGDKVLVSFDEGNMVSEYQMDDAGKWVNVDDETDTFGALTMGMMAQGNGPEKVYKSAANGDVVKRALDAKKAEQAQYLPQDIDSIAAADYGTTVETESGAQYQKIDDDNWKKIAEGPKSMGSPVGTDGYDDEFMTDIQSSLKIVEGPPLVPLTGDEEPVQSTTIDAPPAPEPVTSEFSGLSEQEFSKALIDAPVGTKLIDDYGGVPYRKQEDGSWNQGSKKGVSHYVMYQKRDQLTMLLPAGSAPDSDQPDLPEGVPAGSTPITSDAEVTTGQYVYEAHTNGTLSEYVKQPNGMYTATLPSGLVIQDMDAATVFYDAETSYYLFAGALSAGPSDPTPDDEPLPSGNIQLGYAVGDVIQGVDAMDNLPSGTKLAYTKKDGTQSYYVKLDSGSWLTPGGGVMASIQLKGSANSGKFKVESFPAASAPSVPSGQSYKEGQEIKKFGHLRDMPVGTIVAETSNSGKWIVDFKKFEDGWWSVPNEKFPTSHAISPAELGEDIQAGVLLYKSGPTAEPEQSTTLDTQPWPGAPVMSQAQLSDALKGLSAHTSFHVSYGLKGLPDSHPLSTPENQEAMKIAALNKYPDLKAKPAVMQLLKDAIGIQEGGPVDDSPKVWIGSKTPKSTGVQGLDGGEFSVQEIQQAIEILEGFQGKTFKAELNKKGSPLGTLNPNSIVGFDKDKLVTKQKMIDLLKTKLVVTEEDVKHPLVKDVSELAGLPVGSKISYQGAATLQVYTKINDTQWSLDGYDQEDAGWSVLPESAFTKSIGDGKVRIEAKPDVLPDYAKTPAAVQDKGVSEQDVENFGPEDLYTAALGTVLEGTDPANGKKLIFVRHSGYYPWKQIDSETGEELLGYDHKELKAVWDVWKIGLKQEDGPKVNENSDDGLLPGKYLSKTGKAYMVVNADGTGVYVNSKGDAKSLTAKAVKSNYEAGVSDYQGITDSVPTPTEKKSTPAKPKTVEDLADGVYYGGKPNDPKVTVYEVSGNEVKVFKPNTVPGYKIGGQPDAQWASEASVGAAVKAAGHYNHSVGQWVEESIWTKGDDGKWHPSIDGMEAGGYSDIPGTGWGAKIQSHGVSTVPTTSTKAKVNTLFDQGKLLDADGNSVVPKGYSGQVNFFGSTIPVPALIDFQKELAATDFDTAQQFQNFLKQKGIFFDSKLVGGYTIKHFGEKSIETYKQAFDKAVTDLTDGLDTSIPESDASALFEWNSLGEPKMPLEVASLSAGYYSSVSETTAYIKAASKAIGDGKIIGQHYTKMTKYDKSQWVKAFKDGDFKKMYDLEVAAAAKEGKAHSAGYLHPGYSGNEATNKISWGAAVDGEISALTVVPGEWSDNSVQPSLEEIDNYLIKAQMQNPTYLSNSEKRAWVKHHKVGQKELVDKLSATAALRKKEGQEEQSKPLVWTDNVKPAKVYDHLFDNTPYPLSWTTQAATAYVEDHPANAELQDMVALAKSNHGQYYGATYGVQEYFQKLNDEEEAKKLIPVYTMDPSQTVKKSTHPVYNYTDQFGKKYFFKPRPNTKLDKYRSEVEHLGNQFGKTFGFSTADSKLIEIDGKYGQLQSDVGGVADLMGYDYSTLTVQQIADIGSEHILDWFLDNDDTKGDNAKILPNGRIVGIDKGRAFKHFGAWKGLSGDSSMNSNANTVYSQLFDTIRAGKLSKDDVDAAYLAIRKKAEKMAKVPDSMVSEMLAEGMKNREQWDINYSIDGKKVPNNLAGLTAAVLDRKNRLPEQFEEMWSKVYKQAGFGDLPAKPDNPLGDVISGLDNAQLHTEVFQAKATGKSTMLAGAHIIGGTATIWAQKGSDNSNEVLGEMFLGPKKQKELLDYFNSNSTDLSGNKASVQGFEQFDIYGEKIIGAAKTINHHATDGEYNMTKVNEFLAAKKSIEMDLDEWLPGLEANAEFAGEPSYKFKSGSNVPIQYVDQYKLMLDHYAPSLPVIENAYNDKGKTGKTFEQFKPLKISQGMEKYVHEDGSTLTKMSNGDYIHVLAPDHAVQIIDDSIITVDDAKAGKYGWSEVLASGSEKPASSVVIVKKSQTFEKTALSYNKETGEKIASDVHVNSGASGQEFEVTLPTGEKIYWRNASQTNTAKGQHGKLSFVIPDADNETAVSASMDRIRTQLSVMGIETEAADYEQAELTYWREMYGVLENRSHSATGSKKYGEAYKKMQLKIKEIGSSETEFLENLSETLTPAEEIQYWRELYSEFWPEKVQTLIATEGYLPKFDHQNLSQPELETGKPWWERFDVTADELIATGAILAHSTGGEPDTQGAMSSGGLISGEERIRQLGKIFTGGGYGSSSPVQDQGNGSSHQIYTRIVDKGSLAGYNVFMSPQMLLRTRTYSLSSDNYGNLASRKSGSPSNPLDAIAKFKNSGGNETMLPHIVSLLDGIEVLAFDYADKRNDLIQYLKKLGIEKIRGLPIEDRFVMRKDLQQAIEKVRQTWQMKVAA